MLQTYEQFQNASSTEKLILCTIDPSIRLIGFTLHSGNVYKLTNFDYQLINSIKEEGVAYTEVTSLGSVIVNTYYNDKTNKILYLYATGGVNPSSLFLVMNFKMFFSNIPIELPYDLDDGFEVEWVPYILTTSDFEVELDNENQQGFAIEGTGSIDFANVQEYWAPKFDKITFENKECKIYSYNRDLDPSDAKLLFRGFVQKKAWTQKVVRFNLKDIIFELKKKVELPNIQDLLTYTVTDNLLLAKQRRVYGYVNGHIPTPIDQIVDGYAGTGTISLSLGSKTVTGVGTSFLSELSPDDQITFSNLDGETLSVASITSDTSLELSDEFEFGFFSNRPFSIIPDLPKRYKNRKFLVAGHATREPATTMTEVISSNYFQVANDSDIIVGDRLLINGENAFVRRVSSNKIKLTGTLSSFPLIGSTVVRPSISDVYINDKRLFDDSYEYNANTALLTLDEDAEVLIAKPRIVVGTQITITSGSRSVVGVATSFSSQLKTSDWIKTEGQAEYFEILQIISDTELDLREPATYTSTNIGIYKSPDYYTEGNSVLSVNLIGKTKNGLKTGTFIKTSSDIVEDMLIDAGLEDIIETSSIVESTELAPERVGIVLPKKMADKDTKNFREYIGEISKTVFGSLIQTSDYKLAYRILSPRRILEDRKVDEIDIISFSVNSDSSKIIKTAVVNYDFREYDFLAKNETNKRIEHTPLINEYLTQSTLVNSYDLNILDLSDARTIAERYAFLLQLSRAKINLKTKLILSDLTALDRVWIKTEKLYERIGSIYNQKLSGVQSIKKDGFNVSLEIEDLSGAYSRCSIITENDSNEYDLATEDEILINGFITDNYGMIDNNQETFGINLIW